MTSRNRVPTILHADMDAFYAAVEVLDNPSLRGKPVIIGHRGPRGVVSTASYEARRFGVHSAMPALVAERKCPQAIWLPGRMGRYAAISRLIRQVFLNITPLVEPLSLDEAFLDIAGSLRLFGDPLRIARRIKTEVREVTGGLSVSIGLAENKFLAKIASDLEKPDGLTVVPLGRAEAFLAPLPIERVWGIGKKSAARLHAVGIHKIGDLRRTPVDTLVRLLGQESGERLSRLARGDDRRSVQPERDAKSISTESTFGRDLVDPKEVEDFLYRASVKVAEQLRTESLVARTVRIKVRRPDFKTYTRAQTLEAPTDLPGPIFESARALLHRVDLGGAGIRLLGVGTSGLLPRSTSRQADLFEASELDREERLAQLTDQIRERLGDGAITRARELKPSPAGQDQLSVEEAREERRLRSSD